MADTLFALAVGGYFVIGFVWPTVRSMRRYGTWPIVFARESAPAQRLLGAASGVLFVALLALAALHALVGSEALGVWRVPAPARAAGWLALLLGSLVTVVAQRRMGASWRVGIDDRPTDLVTGGIFRVVRNPIFSGLLLFLVGVTLLSAAWWSVAVLIVTTLALRLQVGFEEEHLIALHGGAYLDYASRTGRFVPLLGRLAARSSAAAGAGAAAATRG